MTSFKQEKNVNQNHWGAARLDRTPFAVAHGTESTHRNRYSVSAVSCSKLRPNLKAVELWLTSLLAAPASRSASTSDEWQEL